MKAYDNNKTPQKEQQAVASGHQAGGKTTYQLADNRPSSLTQKKQVDAMANGAPAQRKENKTGLPDQLKSGIENLSGHSMDDVKVHYNSDKPAQLNAHAYAQGTNIHVAPGQEKHLPHEAWHVVQQKEGRVKPTIQMKEKVNINDDKGLEKEADVMGAKAVQTKSIQGGPEENNVVNNKPQVAQLTAIGDARTEFNLHRQELNNTIPRFNNDEARWNNAPNGRGAEGLNHWAKETRLAAARHYNELRYVADKSSQYIPLRLGRDNRTEPDILKSSNNGSRYHIEIKTTNASKNAEITKLVVEALKQLEKRNPGGSWIARVGLFLTNPNGVWPFNGGTQANAHAATDNAFISALKKKTSVKGSMAASYPNVTNVTFDVHYGASGYRRVAVNLNNL
jgi:hypothetical protein